MALILENIKNSWQFFGIETIHNMFFLLCMIWVALYEKEKKKCYLFWYMIMAVLAVIGLQVVMMLLGRPIMSKTYYLLPVGLLTAMVAIRLSDRYLKSKNRWIIVVLYAIMIQSGIGFDYTGQYVVANYNDIKISSTVVKIVEYIQSVEHIEEPYLLAPEELASQIQEYDPTIRVAYGSGFGYDRTNLDNLLVAVGEYECNFLIVDHEYDNEKYMKRKRYQQVAIYDGYSIYYKK